MTINQYLSRLEVLKIREERAQEKYIRILERASSPASGFINPDGIPRTTSNRSSHEDLIIKAAEAAAESDRAWRKYRAFEKHLERNLKKLDYRERWALEQIYIWNMGKPPEKRRVGVCRWCHCRTKAEAAVLIRQAKQHLTEVLREQGIEIE